MHRLGKKNNGARTRNVIIKLKDKQTRENISEQRKKLIKTGKPSESIYLNDALTPHRQQLLFTARKLLKSKKIFAAWSQQGNILVRKEESSKITQVRDNCDLLEFKFKEPEHVNPDQNSMLSSMSRMTSLVSHLSDYQYYCDSD